MRRYSEALKADVRMTNEPASAAERDPDFGADGLISALSTLGARAPLEILDEDMATGARARELTLLLGAGLTELQR